MLKIYNAFEQKISGFIARRNTDKYIKNKITVSFFSLLLLGILCGIAVYDAIYRSQNISSEYLIHHLEETLKNCVTFSDCISEILSVSKSDIRFLLFIFISGFTYFCFPACGIMVFSKGFLTGFSFFYLIEIYNQFNSTNYSLFFLIFLISKLLLSVITVFLAMSSYIFSYRFREIKSSSSVLRRAPITYRYFFIFIYSIGGALLTNYIYCFLIYHLIK